MKSIESKVRFYEKYPLPEIEKWYLFVKKYYLNETLRKIKGKLYCINNLFVLLTLKLINLKIIIFKVQNNLDVD